MVQLYMDPGRWRLDGRPAGSLKKGNWYIGVPCAACQHTSAILDIPGNVQQPLVGPGIVVTICSRCQVPGEHPTSAAQVFQYLG